MANLLPILLPADVFRTESPQMVGVSYRSARRCEAMGGAFGGCGGHVTVIRGHPDLASLVVSSSQRAGLHSDAVLPFNLFNTRSPSCFPACAPYTCFPCLRTYLTPSICAPRLRPAVACAPTATRQPAHLSDYQPPLPAYDARIRTMSVELDPPELGFKRQYTRR